MESIVRSGLRCAALLAFAGVGPAAAQDTVFVTMRGLAYDSLRGVPLPGAFIALGGTSRTTQSDARGRFTFDSVRAGPHVLQMQHDVLDSIGFAGRSARVTVDATHRDVVIAVPSFATLWRSLCGGVAPRDSGIVYGIVRDLTGNPKTGALVGITWQDASVVKRKNIELKEMGGRVRTDSTGRYVFCGVPIDDAMRLAVSADSVVTAAVDIAPLALRISRRDFRLSRDSGPNRSPELGSVTGIVTGSGGAPVAGAILTMAGVPDVRSDDSGRFVLRNVPAGTRQLEVKAIGAAPLTTIVDVAFNDATPVTLALGKVQTLDAVRVSAPTFRQVMVRNIEERKSLGLGYVRDSTDVGKLAIMAAAFDGIAGLAVRREAGTGFSLVNRRPCGAPLAIWIDRVRLDESVLGTMRPDEIATIEVFLGATTTPPEFMSRTTCGAVVVWTKRYLRA